MASLIRLYGEGLLASGRTIALSPQQAHYLGKVMRCRVGDKIEFFNGQSGAFEAEISILPKRDCALVLGSRTTPPPDEMPLNLCFAPIKRSPMEFMVQKATELGVTHLTPVITERTTAKVMNFERLNSIAIETAKQCGRVSIPKFDEPMVFEALTQTLSGHVIFADEQGDNEQAPWGGNQGQAPAAISALKELNYESAITVLIGPEGGFTPQERAHLLENPLVTAIRLGPRILRADTAALSALTLIQAVLGDWKH